MKNKMNLKKYLITSLIIVIIFLCIFILMSYIEYERLNKNYNDKMYSVLETIRKKYKNVTEEELISILNSDSKMKSHDLRKYGIDGRDNIVKSNEKYLNIFIITDGILVIILSVTLMSVTLKYNKKKDKDIEEIENYIEEINKGNYKLKINNNTEDELSILKNDVYKIMINLKETRDISINDKNKLKDFIEDISHQIKTPLTSILINIDNLEEDDLSPETKEKFIKEIKKNIESINILVKNLLKLARLDTNSVELVNEKTSLNNIINESVSKVKALSDLKNINIKYIGDKNAIINTDKYWQIEATTNILKNAVEHSKSKVLISVEDNKVYTEVDISNDGSEISKKDIKHIFERFYKGENSSPDSAGIGLSLSKEIIEKSNGKVSVESERNLTTFKIKYFKN